MPPKKRSIRSKNPVKQNATKPKATRTRKKQATKTKANTSSTRPPKTPVSAKKIASPRRQVAKSQRAQTFEYDVCLSFAGENRTYVERVAKSLKTKGMRVFYDAYEQTTLWGKDLYAHLDDIYRNKARFCVMFISEAYRHKLWTNHECQSAQARAFRSHQEYILPARFDDTEIPGLRETIGYINLQSLTPAAFAKIVLQKINEANGQITSLPNTSRQVARKNSKTSQTWASASGARTKVTSSRFHRV